MNLFKQREKILSTFYVTVSKRTQILTIYKLTCTLCRSRN